MNKMLLALLLAVHCFLSTGNSERPMLNITEKYLDVPLGTTLYMKCNGTYSLGWKFRYSMNQKETLLQASTNPRAAAVESIIRLEFNDYATTGRYICFYTNASTPEFASVYIFVNSVEQLLLPTDAYPFDILFMEDREVTIVPCLPTNSSAEVILKKSFVFDTDLNWGMDFCLYPMVHEENLPYDPTEGFKISNSSPYYRGPFCCEATLGERKDKIAFVFASRSNKTLTMVIQEIIGYTTANPMLSFDCAFLKTLENSDQSKFYYRWTYSFAEVNRIGIDELSQDFVNSMSSFWSRRGLVLLSLKTLTLHNAKKTDGGFYRCSIMSPLYEVYTSEVFARVHDVEGYPYLKTEGASVEFKADYKIFPSPMEHHWMQDNSIIFQKPGKYEMFQKDGAYILRVHNVSAGDAGTYTFRYSENGFSSQTFFKFSVFPGTPIIATSYLFATFEGSVKGLRSVLRCTRKESEWVHLQWIWRPLCDYKCDTSLSFDVILKPSISIPDKIRPCMGPLGIKYVVYNLTDVPGKYFCRGTNEFGSTEEIVLITNSSEFTRPQNFTPILKVNQFDEFTLSCVANKSLYESIEIWWRRSINDSFEPVKNSVVSSENADVLRTNLPFKRIYHEQSGIYKCSAFSKDIRSRTNEKLIHIFVTDFVPLMLVHPPVLNVSERYLDVPVNTSLYLQCEGSFPLLWYFEAPWIAGVPPVRDFNGSSEKTADGYFRSIIHLEFGSYQNTGKYTCVFNNTVHKESASVYIFVNDMTYIMWPPKDLPFMILFAASERPITIPCLPTHSSTKVTLWKSESTTPNLNSVESFCNDSVAVTVGVSFDPTAGFTIAHPTDSSRGRYCCLATLGSSRTSFNFLIVAMDNKFDSFARTSFPKTPIMVNSSLTFECTLMSTIKSVYYGWSYDVGHGKKLRTKFVPKENTKLQVGSLFLSVADIQKPENWYSCIVMNPSYEAYTCVTFVHIYEPGDPDVNKSEGESVQYIVEGQNGGTDIGIWEKDGEDISLESKRYKVFFNGSVSMIRIDNLVFEDSGIYCYRRKYIGFSWRNYFTLRVTGKPRIETSVPQQSVEMKGNVYDLLCAAKCLPLPDLKLLWKPQKKVISVEDAHFEIEYQTGKFFPNFMEGLKAIRNSTFYSVSLRVRVMINTPGQYFCRSNNTFGVTEKVIPPIGYGKPYATYKGFPVLRITKYDDGIAITCKGNKSLYKSVQINYKPFIGISAVRTKEINSSSEYSNLKKKNIFDLITSKVSGIYECIGYHKNQSLRLNQQSVFIFFSDNRNPFVYATNMDSSVVIIDQNETVELFCYASGSSHLELSWSHNGKIMLPNASGIKFTDDSQKIIFTHFSKHHNGLYKCNAKDTDQVESRNVSLYIREAPYVAETNMNSTNVYFHKGDHFELLCRFGGMPPPNITWYLNGVPIIGNMSVAAVSEDAQKLVIADFDEENNGLYECQAENNMGFMKLNTTLTLTEDHGPKRKELAGIIGGSLSLVVLVTVPIFLLRRFVLSKKKGSVQPHDSRPARSRRRLKINKKYEFPRGRVKLGKTLGKGAFGKVVKARVIGLYKKESTTVVAVKMPKDAADVRQRIALIAELKIMMALGCHLNIVNLLGAVTRNPREPMAILEYCRYGSLRKYLLKHRRTFRSSSADSIIYVSDNDEFFSFTDSESSETPVEERPPGRKRKLQFNIAYFADKPKPGGFASESSGSDTSEMFLRETRRKHSITTEDLVSYSFQCARGLDYITSMDMIHRDVAARNVLLGDNGVVKICDFGLSEDMSKYKIVKKPEEVLMPIKWMAVESIQDKVFSPKSDVWSFGVLLWEIFSLGAEPYPGIAVDENFLSRLKGGYRMEKPDFTPDTIYEVMRDCWNLDPNNRPDFAELTGILGNALQEKVQQYYIKLNKPYQRVNQNLLDSSDSDEDVELSKENPLYECHPEVPRSSGIQDNINFAASYSKESESESFAKSSMSLTETVDSGRRSGHALAENPVEMQSIHSQQVRESPDVL